MSDLDETLIIPEGLRPNLAQFIRTLTAALGTAPVDAVVLCAGLHTVADLVQAVEKLAEDADIDTPFDLYYETIEDHRNKRYLAVFNVYYHVLFVDFADPNGDEEDELQVFQLGVTEKGLCLSGHTWLVNTSPSVPSYFDAPNVAVEFESLLYVDRKVLHRAGTNLPVAGNEDAATCLHQMLQLLDYRDEGTMYLPDDIKVHMGGMFRLLDKLTGRTDSPGYSFEARWDMVNVGGPVKVDQVYGVIADADELFYIGVNVSDDGKRIEDLYLNFTVEGFEDRVIELLYTDEGVQLDLSFAIFQKDGFILEPDVTAAFMAEATEPVKLLCAALLRYMCGYLEGASLVHAQRLRRVLMVPVTFTTPVLQVAA